MGSEYPCPSSRVYLECMILTVAYAGQSAVNDPEPPFRKKSRLAYCLPSTMRFYKCSSAAVQTQFVHAAFIRVFYSTPTELEVKENQSKHVDAPTTCWAVSNTFFCL